MLNALPMIMCLNVNQPMREVPLFDAIHFLILFSWRRLVSHWANHGLMQLIKAYFERFLLKFICPRPSILNFVLYLSGIVLSLCARASVLHVLCLPKIQLCPPLIHCLMSVHFTIFLVGCHFWGDKSIYLVNYLFSLEEICQLLSHFRWMEHFYVFFTIWFQLSAVAARRCA